MKSLRGSFPPPNGDRKNNLRFNVQQDQPFARWNNADDLRAPEARGYR